MDSLDTLLSRLEKLRPAGTGKWLACCPSHQDKSPSLSIKQGDDGTILAYCFAGCGVDDICAAVGLETWQLFPDGKPGISPRERELRGDMDTLRMALKIYKTARESGAATAEDHEEGREIIARIIKLQGLIDAERSAR